MQELDQLIAGLQAANRHEGTTTAELRAAVQREEEQLPVMRQRAETMLTSLKGQVAALMNQSWHLARKIADLRHESALLQSTAAHFKQEAEETQAALPAASASDEEERLFLRPFQRNHRCLWNLQRKNPSWLSSYRLCPLPQVCPPLRRRHRQ